MRARLAHQRAGFRDYFPYSHSTIGDMKDLVDAPLSAVQEFFHAYYAPNNAVLTIVGDFQPEEALGIISKYFGDIPARGRPEYKPGELAPQDSRARRDAGRPAGAAARFPRHLPTSRPTASPTTIRSSCSRCRSATASRRACTKSWSRSANCCRA